MQTDLGPEADQQPVKHRLSTDRVDRMLPGPDGAQGRQRAAGCVLLVAACRAWCSRGAALP